jgi:hypothetical protein
MKHRILPGAAGLIALTATIGFMDGNREMKVENFSRFCISLVSIQLDNTADSMPASTQQDKKLSNQAYLVELIRGCATTEVKVDAFTGRIIS